MQINHVARVQAQISAVCTTRAPYRARPHGHEATAVLAPLLPSGRSALRALAGRVRRRVGLPSVAKGTLGACTGDDVPLLPTPLPPPGFPPARTAAAMARGEADGPAPGAGVPDPRGRVGLSVVTADLATRSCTSLSYRVTEPMVGAPLRQRAPLFVRGLGRAGSGMGARKRAVGGGPWSAA